MKPPHARGKFLGGKDPSATQPAQAISFGEAAGDEETLRINMESRSRRGFKQHFPIDIIRQNISARWARERRNVAHGRIGNKRAAGIVQIAEYDHARSRCEIALEIRQIDGKVLLRSTLEALDLETQITGDAEQRIIRWL